MHILPVLWEHIEILPPPYICKPYVESVAFRFFFSLFFINRKALEILIPFLSFSLRWSFHAMIVLRILVKSSYWMVGRPLQVKIPLENKGWLHENYREKYFTIYYVYIWHCTRFYLYTQRTTVDNSVDGKHHKVN